MPQRANEFRWKFLTIKAALGATSVPEMVDLLFPQERAPSDDAHNSERKERWRKKFEKYHSGRSSTTSSELFAHTKAALTLSISRAMFITCSALEFFSCLTYAQQSTVIAAGNQLLLTVLFPNEENFVSPQPRAPNEPDTAQAAPPLPTLDHLHSHTFGRGLRIFHISPDYRMPRIDAALDRGIFDQTWIYLDTAASTRWQALTSGSRYPTFRNDLETLRDLLDTPEWNDTLKERSLSRIVVFGAGAAAKDIELLDSLAKRPEYGPGKRISYVLIDASFHMLLSTVEDLEDEKGDRYESLLDIFALIGDFMNLDDAIQVLESHGLHFREGQDRTLFWLPGNTIANLDAEAFISNIDRVAQPGDLFLMGLEFADTTNLPAYITQLMDKYNDHAARHLVLPPVRAYLDRKQQDKTRAELDELITVSILEPRRRVGGLNPKAMIGFTANLAPDRKVSLITSARYDRDDVMGFMSKLDFQLIREIQNAKSVLFRQLLFVRGEPVA